MRKTYVFSIGLTFCLAATGFIWGDDSDGAMEDRYVLLATTKTMQNQMDAASERGFRVLMGSPASG